MSNGDGLLETLIGKQSTPLQDQEKNPAAVKEAGELSPDQELGVSHVGLNNDVISEPIPGFATAPSEKVISNNSNAWIVLGRDRPSNVASGYGGQGSTGASSIDLVVGRRPLNPNLQVDPNFISDAARIHISQRTDVDTNFGLVKGSVGKVEGRSAIGMKADEIRLVARGGIKIVTEGRGTFNSQGGKIGSTVGIDLIAGNDDSFMGPLLDFRPGGAIAPSHELLQPNPKEYDLANALEEIVDMLDDVAAMLAETTNGLIKTNIALSAHYHPVFIGPITAPPMVDTLLALSSINTMLGIKAVLPMYSHRINVKTFKFQALTEAGSSWICSRYNKTN